MNIYINITIVWQLRLNLSEADKLIVFCYYSGTTVFKVTLLSGQLLFKVKQVLCTNKSTVKKVSIVIWSP